MCVGAHSVFLFHLQPYLIRSFAIITRRCAQLKKSYLLQDIMTGSFDSRAPQTSKRTDSANKSLKIKSSTTTGKIERKHRKVGSQNKAVSALENNKRAANMSSQFHALLNVTQNTGRAAGTPLP